MIKHKDKIYQPVSAGHFIGFQELKPMDRPTEPCCRWTGKKIPMSLVHQILSFFKWHASSEVVVTLMYHEEQGWAGMVLPQESNGMTVKLLDDHENRIPTYQRFGRGWEPKGTWHHHCSAPAFQSGTDSSDEKGKEGLHLTSGNLNSEEWSLHTRVSFRNTLTPANLEDWFECDLPIAPHLKSEHIEWLLCQPQVVEFPEWWKENVFKPENKWAMQQVNQPQSQLGFVHNRRDQDAFILSIERKISSGTLSVEDIMNFFNMMGESDISIIQSLLAANCWYREGEDAASEWLLEKHQTLLYDGETREETDSLYSESTTETECHS